MTWFMKLECEYDVERIECDDLIVLYLGDVIVKRKRKHDKRETHRKHGKRDDRGNVRPNDRDLHDTRNM